MLLPFFMKLSITIKLGLATCLGESAMSVTSGWRIPFTSDFPNHISPQNSTDIFLIFCVGISKLLKAVSFVLQRKFRAMCSAQGQVVS